MMNEVSIYSIRDVDASGDASNISSVPSTTPANLSKPSNSASAVGKRSQPPSEAGTSAQKGSEDPVNASPQSDAGVAAGQNVSSDSPGEASSEPKPHFSDEGAHPEDENKVRGNWGSPAEFLLSCIGYAVGLGNVWRFPYLCYKNGGGTFLVIYWILHATVGFPLIFLELTLGQFTSQGPTGVWNFAPFVKGLGFSMISICCIGSIYYNVIIAWALYYFVVSFYGFGHDLPWKNCDFDGWANYRCELNNTECTTGNEIRAYDGLCYNLGSEKVEAIPTLCNETVANSTQWLMVPCKFIVDLTNGGPIAPSRNNVVGYWEENLAVHFDRSAQFPTDQYFYHEVLGQYGSVDPVYTATNLGPPQTWLTLSLFFSWVIVYLCMLNGIKTSGKVVYFTALFPYVVLIILIGQGVTLPGAKEGILYLLTPDFTKMQQPGVWYAAASQLFFSLSAWGGMIALSSYNKFHTNTLRDTLIITSADTFTSFIASFAIFSVIGYGAYTFNKPIDKVATQGTGLAFILYPKIIDYMPGSVAFALLFFLMLLLLGLDSQFSGLETLFTSFLDRYPSLRSSRKRKALTFGIFCIPFFLLGLPMVSSGGINLLELVDHYTYGWPVFLIGIIQPLAMAWIYGADNYHKDLAAMMPWLINRKRVARVAPIVLRIYWGVVTPSMLIFVMTFSWIHFKSMDRPGEELLGWFITFFVVMWIPIFAFWVIANESYRRKSCWAGLKAAMSPSPKWGPYLDKHKREVAALHGDTLGAARSVTKSLECIIEEEELPGTSNFAGALHESDVVNARCDGDSVLGNQERFSINNTPQLNVSRPRPRPATKTPNVPASTTVL